MPKPPAARVLLVNTGDAVDDAGNGEGVVRFAPPLAVQRQTARNGPVDIAELVRLNLAISETGPQEGAQVRGDLLLDVDAQSAPAAILANQGGAGRRGGGLAERDRVSESPHASAAQEAGKPDRAVLSADPVTPLDLFDELELTKPWVQLGAVGHLGKIEGAGSQRPVPLVPLGGGADGVAPGVGGVVEGSGDDQRPIQEVVLGIVGELVGVEDVGDVQFADREDQAVGGLGFCPAD